jgi:MATE family multidrug resistance protein
MMSLAMPVVVAEVGWVAMQIVDIIMVGRLGPEAIGAVGVGCALFLALAVVGIGLLLGLDPLVAQAFGAQADGECRAWLRHGLALAVGLTVPLTVVAWMAMACVSARWFDPRVLELTHGYLLVVTWSLLPLLLFTVFRRYLQAVGIVRPVMLTLVTANIINAVANWLLVFGNWGFPALGVEGAAWATCVSRSYMCGLLALVAWRVTARLPRNYSVGPLSRGLEMSRIWQLVRVGWPAAAQMTLEVGVFAVATVLAGRLEPHFLAAHQIVLNTVGLTFMATYGLSSAGAVRVGHAVGRLDLMAARRSGWVALGIGAAFMAVSAVGFLTVPQSILRIFTSDARVIEAGVLLLSVAAVFQLFDGLQTVATGILRGLGDTWTPMLCNLAGHWCVGLPVGYALCFWWGWGVVGLWLGLSLGLILIGSLLVPVWHYRIEAMQQASMVDKTAFRA